MSVSLQNFRKYLPLVATTKFFSGEDMYYNMRTWPLDEIFPDKFTNYKFELDVKEIEG